MKQYISFGISLILHLSLAYVAIILDTTKPQTPIEIELTMEMPTPPQNGEADAKPQEVEEIIIPMDESGDKDCPSWYGGIGIESSFDDIITSIANGYPAHKSGLKVGDKMFYQGDIRGTPGTSIDIRVLRNNTDILFFTIIREKICYTN